MEEELCDVFSDCMISPNPDASIANIQRHVHELETLVQLSKSPTYRAESHQRDINFAKDLIVTYFAQLIRQDSVNDDLESAILHGLRYLRNVCVEAPHGQEYLFHVQVHLLTGELILQTLQSRITLQNKSVISIPRICMQILCNMSVQQTFIQNEIWSMCYDRIFYVGLNCSDEVVRAYTCATLYNTLSGQERSLCDPLRGRPIVMAVLELQTCEWREFVIERLLQENFLPDLFDCLENQCHLTLLKHVEVLLKRDISNPYVNGSIYLRQPIIPENTCLYISDKFLSICGVIAQYANTRQFTEEMQLAMKLLDILGYATSLNTLYPNLHNQLLLVRAALELLRSIYEVDQQSDGGIFSKIQDTPTELNNPGSHTDNLKKNLIRLIGNMSYRNRIIQDEIRILGGIPLLLNQCRFDVCNPFVTQWCILAIRNLCDENIENQNVIAELNIKGVVNSTALNELGLEVTMQSGRIRVKQKEHDNASI
ncbi:Ataxin-10 [Trichoplax sp. H2]|nr:Ataxin-10 [Trichoplax sp. H2]|eukprot:RDD41597.1 Ataxin-10 [Trichoplax sp. H2]